MIEIDFISNSGSESGCAARKAHAEDIQLIRAVIANREGATARLLGKFEDLINLISWTHCRGNLWDRQDIAQDISMHVIIKVKEWNADRGSLSGFVATIARHKAIDWTRRTGHYTEEVSLQEIEMTQEDAHSDPRRLASISAVRECVERILEPHYRQVLELYLLGMDYEQIGERLACPKGTVATWLHRAKAELKPHLEHSLAALSLSKVA